MFSQKHIAVCGVSSQSDIDAQWIELKKEKYGFMEKKDHHVLCSCGHKVSTDMWNYNRHLNSYYHKRHSKKNQEKSDEVIVLEESDDDEVIVLEESDDDEVIVLEKGTFNTPILV